MSSITVLCDTVIEHAKGRIADFTADAERLYQKNIDLCLEWNNRKRWFFKQGNWTRQQMIDLMEKNALDRCGPLHWRNESIKSMSHRCHLLIRAAAACSDRRMTLSIEDANFLKLPPR